MPASAAGMTWIAPSRMRWMMSGRSSSAVSERLTSISVTSRSSSARTAAVPRFTWPPASNHIRDTPGVKRTGPPAAHSVRRWGLGNGLRRSQTGEMELTREQAVWIYERMRLIRSFEERVARLFADGRIPGFVHLYAGEEAVAVGVCAHLGDRDYITSTHRGHGHCIAKGVPVNEMMAELFGRATGSCK